MYVVSALFIAMLITALFWLYHTFQFYRKRNDALVRVAAVDRHEAKSTGFLIVLVGLMIVLWLSLFLM